MGVILPDERKKEEAAACATSSKNVERAGGLVAVATTRATAASTAAVATAATATTPAATTVATASTTATATVFLGLGFVDGEGATVMLLPVEGCNGGLRFFITAHFHESETLAPTGIPVLDHLSALDGAVLGAQLLQIGVRDIVAQISDVQFPAHFNAPASWAK
jgi:hypothetical protein